MSYSIPIISAIAMETGHAVSVVEALFHQLKSYDATLQALQRLSVVLEDIDVMNDCHAK